MKLEEPLKSLLLFILGCWIVLAIIFGLSDLEISKAFLNKESIWANIGKYYGEGPGYGLIAIAIGILIGSREDDLKKQRTALYVILIIGIVFIIMAITFENLWFITFGGGILFPVLLFLLFTRGKDLKEYKTIATVIIWLAIINPLIFVQITKVMCGRVRFNDLLPGYSNYTPWYLPPGPLSGIKGNASFPSGHTAMGWMFLPLLIGVRNRKWNDPVKILVIVLVIGFGLFLGASRIVTGDHYASDILFSTGVAAIATIWLYQKYYKNKA